MGHSYRSPFSVPQQPDPEVPLFLFHIPVRSAPVQIGSSTGVPPNLSRFIRGNATCARLGPSPHPDMAARVMFVHS
jgi:hypothetical protein